MAASTAPLRVGFVPEHFSTPLHYALTRFPPADQAVPAAKPYPSGTGAMAAALKAGEIDIAIGLTEGFVAALGKARSRVGSDRESGGAGDDDPGFRLVGTYVTSPLRWAISTGTPGATEGAGFARSTPAPASVSELKGGRVGVSRIGSGSYVMAFVLAEREGWLDGGGGGGGAAGGGGDGGGGGGVGEPFSDFVVLDTFANLRRAVNDGRADFFMWEHFTTKRYHDAGEVARVGDIYTPWASWLVVASTQLLGGIGSGSGGSSAPDARVASFLASLDKGVAHFNARRHYHGHHTSAPEQLFDDDPVAYISGNLDYSADDAREWLATVEFAAPTTRGVQLDLVNGCVGVLRKAGVLPPPGSGRMETEEMIVGV